MSQRPLRPGPPLRRSRPIELQGAEILRDVAVIGFAQETAVDDRERNEVEIVSPVVREAIARSGMKRRDIDFTISGSCDYLAGGPFTFVMGLDGVGAWPPVKESHVEMDAAWALYEAWVAIQTGDVDSAIIYGFGKASLGDLHEIWTLQTDPYTVATLWPSMVDMAALQADAYLTSSGRTDRDLAEVAARQPAQRAGQPARGGLGGRERRRPARPAGHPPAAARQRHRTGHRRRGRDRDRGRRRRQAVLRAAGLDPRHRAPGRPAAHRAAGPGHGAVGRRWRRRRPARADGAIDVAEIHAQFSHEELILREALGLGDGVDVNPSGGALTSNPMMAAGLVRIGEVANRIIDGRAGRGVAHAAQGPCLQQNLVCVLEGEAN